MSRRVLLVGATGLVGGRALEHLLASPRVVARVSGVTVLARRTTGRSDTRLEERVVDFEAPLEGLEGHTDVLCALGTTMKQAGSKDAFRRVDHDIPLRVAEAARRAGARSFALVSSVGADARSSSFYLRTKGELEEALRVLGFPALHLLRPGVLLGERAAPRFGERLGAAAMKVGASLLVGGLRRYRAIEGDVVARALVATALLEGNAREGGARVHEHHDQVDQHGAV